MFLLFPAVQAEESPILFFTKAHQGCISKFAGLLYSRLCILPFSSTILMGFRDSQTDPIIFLSFGSVSHYPKTIPQQNNLDPHCSKTHRTLTGFRVFFATMTVSRALCFNVLWTSLITIPKARRGKIPCRQIGRIPSTSS